MRWRKDYLSVRRIFPSFFMSKIKLSQVQEKLKADEVAVEIIRARNYDQDLLIVAGISRW